ncbi:MAG: CPBP family intramembrane glutamic endopeptidase [Myxococcota bacterium]
MARPLRSALVLYGVFTALALLWSVAEGRALFLPPGPAWWALPPLAASALSLGLGLLLALVMVTATRVLVRRTRWARDLHVSFRGLLGPLSSAQITLLAVTSGVAEELFFRGAMQPAFGLPLTALIFGLLHVGPGRAFVPWTLWAVLMGFCFGAIVAATGSLAGCVLAHVLINDRNLRFIAAHDPRPAPSRPRRPEPLPAPLGATLASPLREADTWARR